MRAVIIEQFGRPGRLASVELPDPIPAAGQVLVEVEAIGVGGVDAYIRSGAVAAYGFQPGFVPGGEVAGAVTAVGQDVDRSWTGRRVWAFLGLGGGYADRAVAAVQSLVPLPDGLSADDAVTVGSSGIVAHFALRHAHLGPADTVLVRGAAGGLGVMTVQLAARAGATTVAVTTSSPERGQRLRALGATHVLDRTGDGPDAPAGYDVIIDVIAGAGLTAMLDRLNPNGRLVAIGGLGGAPPANLATELFARFQRSLSLATFSANTIPVGARNTVVADLFSATLDGTLQSVIHNRLPLAHAAEAHRAMDVGEIFGRLVLHP